MRKDYTGMEFGELVAVRPTGQVLRNNAIWEFRCSCGALVERAVHSVAGSVRKGCIPRCRKCHPGSRQLAQGRASRNIVVRGYLRRYPEMRNITDEEFDSLFAGNCYICGAPPSNTQENPQNYGGFTYNSIDAVDPAQGHIRGNLASCCTECNQRKWGSTPKELFEWMIRVQRHRGIP